MRSRVGEQAGNLPSNDPLVAIVPGTNNKSNCRFTLICHEVIMYMSVKTCVGVVFCSLRHSKGSHGRIANFRSAKAGDKIIGLGCGEGPKAY
jgi:hypothetical protein